MVLGTAMASAQGWNVGSGGNPSRNCLSAEVIGPAGADLLWQQPAATAFHQQTVIDGKIVVTSPIIDINDVWHGSLIVARDLDTGDTLWTVDLPVDFPNTDWRSRVSGCRNGVVYATRSGNTNASYVYALDASDGSILWKSDALVDEYGSESCSFAENGNLVLGNLFDILCLSATTGETIWQTPRPDAAPASGGQEVAVHGNRGYYWIADSNGPQITVIDLESGQNLYSSGSVSPGLVQQSTLFVGSDGTVYAPRSQGNPMTDFLVAYADDGVSLVEKWRTPIGFIPFSTSGEGADGSIYTYSASGGLIRLNPANGAVMNTSVPFLMESVNSPRMALDKSGQVFVTNGGQDGAIYSFNPDLTLDWTVDVGVLYHGGPALADNGTLIVCSSTHVFAYKGAGTSEVEDISVQGYSIYPNPADDHLFIGGLNEHDHLTIHDLTGKLIFAGRGNQDGLDIGNFQSGIYVVKIDTAQGVMVGKFVKR